MIDAAASSAENLDSASELNPGPLLEVAQSIQFGEADGDLDLTRTLD